MSGITNLDARPQDCPSGLYKDLFSHDIVGRERVQFGEARLANCICADGRFESNSSGSSSIAGVSCANCTGACVLHFAPCVLVCASIVAAAAYARFVPVLTAVRLQWGIFVSGLRQHGVRRGHGHGQRTRTVNLWNLRLH